MRAVEFRVDGRQILVPIAILPPDDGTLIHRTRALIDTGATISGVSREIADHLNLPKRGKLAITTPSGQSVARLRLARFGFFPVVARTMLPATLPFVLPDELLAIECSPGAAFEVLIGMDVLARCDLNLCRDGSGTLTL